MVMNLVATGDDTVDRDHEDIYAHLMALCDGRPADAAAVGDLIALCEDHFADEADLMDALPEAIRRRHQGAHAAFLDRLGLCLEEARSAGSADPGRIKDLTLWFVVHSNTADLEMVACMRQRQRESARDDARRILDGLRRIAEG